MSAAAVVEAEPHKQTLLDIGADMQALADLIGECGEELTPEVEEALSVWFAEVDSDLHGKLDGYCALIGSYELDALGLRTEIDRLSVRVRVKENAAERLKKRLLLFWEMRKLGTVETARYQIRSQKNGGKQGLDVTADPSTLPFEFQKVTTTADEDKLRAALATGVVVDGVSLKPRGKHLRIS